MSSITITVPDETVPRILAAFDPEQKPQGMSDADWMKLRIIQFVSRKVEIYEKTQAISKITVTSVNVT